MWSLYSFTLQRPVKKKNLEALRSWDASENCHVYQQHGCLGSQPLWQPFTWMFILRKHQYVLWSLLQSKFYSTEILSCEIPSCSWEQKIGKWKPTLVIIFSFRWYIICDIGTNISRFISRNKRWSEEIDSHIRVKSAVSWWCNALWDMLVESIIWESLFLASWWAAFGHLVHFGGIKASVLAGSFTFVAETQGEQNSPLYGGDLSTILGPRSPISHFVLRVCVYLGMEWTVELGYSAQ